VDVAAGPWLVLPALLFYPRESLSGRERVAMRGLAVLSGGAAAAAGGGFTTHFRTTAIASSRPSWSERSSAADGSAAADAVVDVEAEQKRAVKAMHQHAKNKHYGKALKLLSHLRHKGVPRNQAIFKALLLCLGRAGRWEEARSVLRKIPEDGVELDVALYTAAIRAMGGRWRESLALLEEMKTTGVTPDEMTYSCAIQSCGLGREWAKAVKLVDDMEQQGLLPNEIVMNNLMQALGHSREHKLVIALLRNMEARGLQPNIITMNSAIACCVKADGSMKDALSLLESMKKRGLNPDVRTYTLLISGWGIRSNLEGVISLLSEALEVVEHPDVVMFNGALEACAFAGWDHACESILKKMNSIGVTPDALSYGFLALAQFERGDFIAPLHTLAEMEKRGLKPTVELVKTAVRAYAAKHMGKEAAEVLSYMNRMGVTCGRLVEIDLYMVAVESCLKAKHVDISLNLLQHVSNEVKSGNEEDMLEQIRISISQSDLAKALNLAREFSALVDPAERNASPRPSKSRVG
jgi:pentatricopeptide repeat protein